MKRLSSLTILKMVWMRMAGPYIPRVKHLKTKDKVERYRIQQATHYYADFVYTNSDGKEVVVDTKSEYTRTLADYRLKKKMMLAFKGIAITEVVLKR